MPFDLARIRAICFDVDGTLRETDDQYALRLARWLWPLRAFLPYRNPLLRAISPLYRQYRDQFTPICTGFASNLLLRAINAYIIKA